MLTINHIAAAADALHRAGKPDLAADFWAAALDAAPDDPVILTAAGVTFRAMQQPAKAEPLLRRALAIEPTARRHVILGCAIHDQFRFDECEAEMRVARQIDPSSAQAANLLAVWLLERWHWRDTSDAVLDEAIAHINAAIELAPENVEFHSARLAMLIAADRLVEVMSDATALIERWPTCVEFHLHRASASMRLGSLGAGYREFAEWAYWVPRVAAHPFHAYPKWSRDAKAGDREVVVWNVEGAGDYFQFVRFAREMAADGFAVKCLANPTMDRLIARVPGVAAVVSETTEIPAGTTLAALPALPAAYVGAAPLWSGPYLSADDATTARWGDRLSRSTLKIGVAWRGNPKQANDERRSFDVSRLAPLWSMPGVSLVSLQHGHRDELAGTPIADLGDDYQAGDWLDTAGVIANLDLVISPCTAVAHLAGTMGKPVWLALSEPGCWRWMRERSDSPWYPTMRIFRQRMRGSWNGVFEAMAMALGKRATTAA